MKRIAIPVAAPLALFAILAPVAVSAQCMLANPSFECFVSAELGHTQDLI